MRFPRFPLPPRRLRREVNALLRDFFQEHDYDNFNRALGLTCEFFKVKVPTIVWHRYLDTKQWRMKTNEWTYGRTDSDNVVHFIRPAYLVKYPARLNTEDEFVDTFWHEIYHVVTMVDAEDRACRFAKLMLEDE